jgi:hypothetical protein
MPAAPISIKSTLITQNELKYYYRPAMHANPGSFLSRVFRKEFALVEREMKVIDCLSAVIVKHASLELSAIFAR